MFGKKCYGHDHSGHTRGSSTDLESPVRPYITVQHVSAYTIVRAMCQVNGGGSFSPPWCSETPKPIHLKFGTFEIWHVRRPTSHAKYSGRRKWAVGWAYGLYPRVLLIFLVPSTRPINDPEIIWKCLEVLRP